MQIGPKWKIPDVVTISLAAAAATALTFLLVWLSSSRYLHELFFERSWIQYATTFVFWTTMAILGLKHLAFLREKAAYEEARRIVAGPDFDSALVWSDAEFVRDKFAEPSDRRHRPSVVFSRIVNALDRLRKMQSTQAMEEYFQTRSEFDGAELETGYAGVRYCVWLIPTLGFVGTVMGIGAGIGGFAQIIQRAQNFKEVQQFLPDVTRMLGTAFDTTLLALALGAIAIYYMSSLGRRQEQLLEEIDNLCIDGICSRFQEHSTTTDNIVRAIRENVEQTIERMNGNRGAIEQVLRHELPVLLSREQAAAWQPLQETLGGILQQIADRTVQMSAAQTRWEQQVLDELRNLTAVQARLSEAISAMQRQARSSVQLLDQPPDPQ